MIVFLASGYKNTYTKIDRGIKMKKIKKHVFECIGHTPMIAINHYNLKYRTNIFAKVEYFNPAGSVKDRVAKYMIDAAFKNQTLKEGYTIIEPTSGNTGIGLACYGTIKGCNVILTMPESMSKERQLLLKAYGAQLVLTPAQLGMQGAIDKANQLLHSIPHSIILGQFDNHNNVLAHFETTGPEMIEDMDGQIDYFVSAIGTGGTISGVGSYLKEVNPKIKVIGVEPKSSPYLTKKIVGTHQIQGIGAGFIPSILDLNVIDEIYTVSDKEAFECSRYLAKEEGFCVGISSGAAFAVAKKIANSFPDKNIVVLFPDSGERYLSTSLYEEKL